MRKKVASKDYCLFASFMIVPSRPRTSQHNNTVASRTRKRSKPSWKLVRSSSGTFAVSTSSVKRIQIATAKETLITRRFVAFNRIKLCSLLLHSKNSSQTTVLVAFPLRSLKRQLQYTPMPVPKNRTKSVFLDFSKTYRLNLYSKEKF